MTKKTYESRAKEVKDYSDMIFNIMNEDDLELDTSISIIASMLMNMLEFLNSESPSDFIPLRTRLIASLNSIDAPKPLINKNMLN